MHTFRSLVCRIKRKTVPFPFAHNHCATTAWRVGTPPEPNGGWQPPVPATLQPLPPAPGHRCTLSTFEEEAAGGRARAVAGACPEPRPGPAIASTPPARGRTQTLPGRTSPRPGPPDPFVTWPWLPDSVGNIMVVRGFPLQFPLVGSGSVVDKPRGRPEARHDRRHRHARLGRYGTI